MLCQCPSCGHQFKPYSITYTSQCLQCGVNFERNRKGKFCSKRCCKKHRRIRQSKTEEYKHKRRLAYYRKVKTNPQFAEQSRLKARAYWAKARSENPGYVLKNYLRARMRRLLRRPTNNFSALIGCSPVELKRHIESRFTKKMSWNNYGDYWVVDHIQPLSSFDLSDPNQMKIACHFTNLQPLTAEYNSEKAGKVTQPQMSLLL